MGADRLSAGVLQQQHGQAVLASERDRPRRPGAIERVPQIEFVRRTIEALRRLTSGGRLHRQHRAAAAIGAGVRAAMEDALPILAQHRKLCPVRRYEERRQIHLLRFGLRRRLRLEPLVLWEYRGRTATRLL
jgi:hypothetical protein